MLSRLITSSVLFLAVAATASSTDDVDQIVRAIGVDSIHSEDEEPRTRKMLAEAFAALNKTRKASPLAAEGPFFEEQLQSAIQSNQALRRSPQVYEAYRETLSRMLTPEELSQAAAFYGSPVGRRAHIAVIEAEKSAGAAMDRLSSGKQ